MNALFRGWCIVLLAAGAAVLAQDPGPAGAAEKPRAAEMARRAASTLLLGVARAGDSLVAVGDRGNILRSADGQRWEQVPVPVHVTLTAVAFADAANGWAVGHDATILHTADGGKTWALQQFRPEMGQPLLNVAALDAQRAYGVGAYGMFVRTTDGGATWSEVDAPAVREDGLHLNALLRLGDGSLFVVGETGLVGISGDGGSRWQRLSLPYEGSLFGALPRGEKGALVFGLRGNVLVTEDVRAGTWTPIDLGTVQSMFGGTLLADGRAVLVGADGEIVVVDRAGHARRASPAAGSLSGALADAHGLQLVGETGATRAALP